ncbi:MAG: hypothetical protein AAGD01_17365 [Acidobacteriota bacterium]
MTADTHWSRFFYAFTPKGFTSTNDTFDFFRTDRVFWYEEAFADLQEASPTATALAAGPEFDNTSIYVLKGSYEGSGSTPSSFEVLVLNPYLSSDPPRPPYIVGCFSKDDGAAVTFAGKRLNPGWTPSAEEHQTIELLNRPQTPPSPTGAGPTTMRLLISGFGDPIEPVEPGFRIILDLEDERITRFDIVNYQDESVLRGAYGVVGDPIEAYRGPNGQGVWQISWQEADGGASWQFLVIQVNGRLMGTLVPGSGTAPFNDPDGIEPQQRIGVFAAENESTDG